MIRKLKGKGCFVCFSVLGVCVLLVTLFECPLCSQFLSLSLSLSAVKLHASLCTLVACMFTTAGLELTTPHESKGWQLQTTLVDCLFEHYSTCTCKQSDHRF